MAAIEVPDKTVVVVVVQGETPVVQQDMEQELLAKAIVVVQPRAVPGPVVRAVAGPAA